MPQGSPRPSPSSSLPLLIALSLAFVPMLAGGPIGAQGDQSQVSQLLHITYVTLKPETAPQWAMLQRDEQIPAQKKAGLLWRDTWASAQSGDTYLRAIVTPVSALSQYDGANPLIKVLGESGTQALGDKVRRFIDSGQQMIIRTRPDLGYGARSARPTLAVLATVTVAPARVAEFESLIKSEIAPAYKKANVSYYAVSQVVYGGDTNQYMTLVPVENFAALAKGHPLELALGPAGAARLTQKAGATITKLERTIVRYLPDLSFQAVPATSQ